MSERKSILRDAHSGCSQTSESITRYRRTWRVCEGLFQRYVFTIFSANACFCASKASASSDNVVFKSFRNCALEGVKRSWCSKEGLSSKDGFPSDTLLSSERMFSSWSLVSPVSVSGKTLGEKSSSCPIMLCAMLIKGWKDKTSI